MIELYTAPTPNGWKASITLKEMGLDLTNVSEEDAHMMAETARTLLTR